MAQGEVASLPRFGEMAPSSRDESHQIEQFAEFVKFRDAVLSGSHPRIKVPTHLLAAKSGDSPRLSPLNPYSAPSSSSPSPSQSPAGAGAVAAPAAEPAAAATTTPITNGAGLSVNATRSQIDRDRGRDHTVGNFQAFHANNSLQSGAVTTNLPGLGSISSFAPAPAPTPAAASAAIASTSNSSNSMASGAKLPFGSARAEIDPIFLEKSDHLIKTEIQLQRQRIERSLKEQLEQRRSSSKALQPSEPLPEFDLEDVLQKALVLVDQTAPPSTDANDANVTANKSDASDSFDDNTFYSSDFDSPDSTHVSRIPDESEDSDEGVEMRESPDYEPVLNLPPPAPAAAAVEAAPSAPPAPASPPPQTAPAPAERGEPAYEPHHHHQLQQGPRFPGSLDSPPSPLLPRTETRPATERSLHPNDSHAGIPHAGHAGSEANIDQLSRVQIISSQESGDASGSGEWGNTDNEQSNDDRGAQPAAPRFPPAFEAGGPTVVRAHDLSPLAPQPAHVSPLATSRQPPAGLQERQGPRGTAAQVVALRNELSVASSPESSPQAAKAAEKRRKKKNKRKADRQAVDVSPYIKEEPRSPSPMSALPAARPHKRPRPSQRIMDELTFEESRYPGGLPDESYREPLDAPVHREDGSRVIYERPDGHLSHIGGAALMAVPSPHRYEPDIYEIRRPPTTTQFVRNGPPSPGSYHHIQYAPSEARTVRSVSHAVADRLYRDAPVYYRDAREEQQPRITTAMRPVSVRPMSVRPGADRDRDRSRSPIMRETRTPAMAPPPRSSHPARIIVDEFGREYIEPPRSAIRQSMAPSAGRHGEGAIYEQNPLLPQPVRAMSRMPPEMYGNEVIYARAASPAYSRPEPRRVITQPEYTGGEYRSYRQREYHSPREAGAYQVYTPEGQAGPPPEQRAMLLQDEPAAPPREYLARPASVRAAAEPIRYEVGRSYLDRSGSVHPEPPLREQQYHQQPPPMREPPMQEPMREYTASGRPLQPRREVIYHHQQPPHQQQQQPIAREYSVRPETSQPIYDPYRGMPMEQQPPYYQQRAVRGGDEDVTYIERPRGGGGIEAPIFVDSPRHEMYRSTAWRDGGAAP